MNEIEHIESDIPQEEQKYKGWFYVWPNKKFYRWSDSQELAKQYDSQQRRKLSYPDGKMGIGSYDKLTSEEQKEALKAYEYKGFGPKNERYV